jgi:hypothetical protein
MLQKALPSALHLKYRAAQPAFRHPEADRDLKSGFWRFVQDFLLPA